jgi:hypothetical protein
MTVGAMAAARSACAAESESICNHEAGANIPANFMIDAYYDGSNTVGQPFTQPFAHRHDPERRPTHGHPAVPMGCISGMSVAWCA